MESDSPAISLVIPKNVEIKIQGILLSIVLTICSLSTAAETQKCEADISNFDAYISLLENAAGSLSGTDANDSFEKFLGCLPFIKESGLYVVEGDLLMTRDQVEQYVSRNAYRRPTTPGNGELVVDTSYVDGKDNIFPMDGRHITFWLDKQDLLPDEVALLNAWLESAAKKWNALCPECGINFDFISDCDDFTSCGRKLDFAIRFDRWLPIPATAMSPLPIINWREEDPKSFDVDAQPVVRLGAKIFSPDQVDNGASIMLHEFGHILGYRHENIHERRLSSTCFTSESGDWREPQAFDPRSIMYVPCNQSPLQKFSQVDAKSHAETYAPETATVSVDVTSLDIDADVNALVTKLSKLGGIFPVDEKTRTLEKGKNLTKLCENHWGLDDCSSLVGFIAKYNNIKDTTRVPEGTEIKFPKFDVIHFSEAYNLNSLPPNLKENAKKAIDNESVDVEFVQTRRAEYASGEFRGLRVTVSDVPEASAKEANKIVRELERTRTLIDGMSPYLTPQVKSNAKIEEDFEKDIDSELRLLHHRALFYAGKKTHSAKRLPTQGAEGRYIEMLDWIKKSHYEPPACVNHCTATDTKYCPRLIYIDRPVAHHPDLTQNPDGEPSCQQDSISTSADGKWISEDDHGTHMVGVNNACPQNEYGLSGLVPGVPYTAHPYGKEFTKTSNLLQYLSLHTQKNAKYLPIFVLASQIPPEEPPGGDGTITTSYPTNEIDPDRFDSNPVTRRLKNRHKHVWVVAAGDNRASKHGKHPKIDKDSYIAPMNLGDSYSVIVATACSKCERGSSKIHDHAAISTLVPLHDNSSITLPMMVNIAAPGGPVWGLDNCPNCSSRAWYSKADGANTSHATAFTAGVVSGMLSCYSDYYSQKKIIETVDVKRRLLQTSWPSHLTSTNVQSLEVTSGIIDPVAAWLHPDLTWLKLRGDESCYKPAKAALLGHKCGIIKGLTPSELYEKYKEDKLTYSWNTGSVLLRGGGTPVERSTKNILRIARKSGNTNKFFVFSGLTRDVGDPNFQFVRIAQGRLNSMESPLFTITIANKSDQWPANEIIDIILPGLR